MTRSGLFEAIILAKNRNNLTVTRQGREQGGSRATLSLINDDTSKNYGRKLLTNSVAAQNCVQQYISSPLSRLSIKLLIYCLVDSKFGGLARITT